MVPSERPRARQIMGNESMSASGVDVSHDVEQNALLSLRLHMNILETAERPAEKMSAQWSSTHVRMCIYYARV